MPGRVIALLAAGCMAVACGCGKSESTGPVAAASSGTSGSVPDDPIAKVVYEFFDAVRRGDTTQANQWLTPLALKRITEEQMIVTPPGSPTASFQVGAVTTRQDDHALVELTWSDVDADGNRYHEPLMLCELRICEGQWRICGMAQDLGPSRPPMLMDFETGEGISAPKPKPPQILASDAPAAIPGKQVAQDPFQQPLQR